MTILFPSHLSAGFPLGHLRATYPWCVLPAGVALALPMDCVPVSQNMSPLFVSKMTSTSRLPRNASFNYKFRFQGEHADYAWVS